MIERGSEGRGVRGLIDSLGQLFRSSRADALEPGRTNRRFAEVESEFETLVAAISKRMERQRPLTQSADPQRLTAQELAEQRRRRKVDAHRAMRADIEEMHARLRTGLTGPDLDEIVAFLQRLDGAVASGRDSQLVLPRVRHAIAQRLRTESGPMALDRLLKKLKRSGLRWPDPPQYHPWASGEEIERSRQRRLNDVRKAFIAYGLERIAERAQGIVWGWGADYPDRGSRLWRESVLVGVAAAIWGRLLQHFVELLRQDGDLLLARAEESLGERLSALHSVIENRSASVAEAREAVASSVRVLDHMIPETAWRLVQARLPRARPRPALEVSDARMLPQRARAAERP